VGIAYPDKCIDSRSSERPDEKICMPIQKITNAKSRIAMRLPMLPSIRWKWTAYRMHT
jgi:hypothetical protein